MKGVSTIIATILILMITIGLAGTAYLYISATFSRQLEGIDVGDPFCSAGSVTIPLKNIGLTTITSVTCQQIIPSGDTGTPCTATASSVALTIQPGATANLVDTCSGTGARTCIYRITPPTGRTVTAPVSCPS